MHLKILKGLSLGLSFQILSILVLSLSLSILQISCKFRIRKWVFLGAYVCIVSKIKYNFMNLAIIEILNVINKESLWSVNLLLYSFHRILCVRI